MADSNPPRIPNWYGWSVYTIAAVYESDQAAREVQEGLTSWAYLEACIWVEMQESDLDKKCSSQLTQD